MHIAEVKSHMLLFCFALQYIQYSSPVSCIPDALVGLARDLIKKMSVMINEK